MRDRGISGVILDTASITRTVALELASDDIRVNAIAPGFISAQQTAAITLSEHAHRTRKWSSTGS